MLLNLDVLNQKLQILSLSFRPLTMLQIAEILKNMNWWKEEMPKLHCGIGLKERIIVGSKIKSPMAQGRRQNTHFFHAIATIRKRKNSIESIIQNGSVIDKPGEIRKVVVDYFQSIISESSNNRPIFNNLDFS